MPHEIDVEELSRLLGEATPGPWEFDGQLVVAPSVLGGVEVISAGYTRDYDGTIHGVLSLTDNDAQLLARSPTLAQAYLDLRERVEWRPIETIGTPKGLVLLARGNEAYVCYWLTKSEFGPCWATLDGSMILNATHWRPVSPPAPTDEEG